MLNPSSILQTFWGKSLHSQRMSVAFGRMIASNGFALGDLAVGDLAVGDLAFKPILEP
jgi:hypothetical protein